MYIVSQLKHIIKCQNLQKFKIKIKKMQYMDVLLSYTQSSDPQQIFELLDILGQGAYGSVSKAMHKQTGELYAIKILPATSVNQISVIKKEIAILRQCNDQHIVKYYGSYFKDNNLWIVMQYCMAGSVTDIVNITQKQLTEQQIASILQLVLKGLKYLHDRKKIHRDIKAANILLDQNGTAKLADFGVSTEMMYTNARHNTHIGSPYWMSPQVIKYSEYNQKTDIWSLGVTAIQLAEGVVPYSHLKPFMAMWTMKDKPVQGFKEPEQWSPQFNDFLKQCLQINPQNRPDAQTLLHHDFIRKNSKGKRLLAQLVKNSMAQIQNFRAGQAHALQQQQQQQAQEGNLKNIKFSKGDSGSEYQSKTVIIKGSQQKRSEVDSVIERSVGSSQKADSIQQKGYDEGYDEYDAECGSVVIRGEGGHSRNCSEISVSSVIVKDDGQHNNSSSQPKQQQSNYLQSYIASMQSQHSQQQQFRQSIQQRITTIQSTFLTQIQHQYHKTKQTLQQFFSHNTQQHLTFESKLFSSSSILQYLYNHQTFLQHKQKLQQQYKEKYLGNIQPVENNYLSMMLDSGQDGDSCGDMNVIVDGEGSDGGWVVRADNGQKKINANGRGNSHGLEHEYRKKSQSSADSPTSLFNNRKKNIKKLIIQQTLQDSSFQKPLLKDSQSVNTDLKHSPAKQQSSFNKFLQQTPSIAPQRKYPELFTSSANFPTKTLMSTGNYPGSNFRGQKRVITTEPHEAYEHDDSLSTLTKLNHRNLKQFYDDPVVLNNLKQLTQQSEEFFVVNPLSEFQLKKSSFSKQIKSVKSKQKDPKIMRQKQRATHIAHTAMAHNKDRTITNSTKKLKVIKVLQQKQKQRQKSPQDQSTKTSKNKKSKSKNKQTASTTIPFGSVGNMGALQFLPGKMGKSKEKRQIPVKSGPFSKIKNKN